MPGHDALSRFVVALSGGPRGCHQQGMRADALVNAGNIGSFLNRAMKLPRRDQMGAATPRKQPAVRQHHAAPLSFASPKPQQFDELRRKHGIASLRPCLVQPDQHTFGVDVIDLEMGDLGGAQAAS